jgi:hypothetical protein
MATYKNTNAGALTFPTLQDPDGNVLVVEAGATFDAPEGLTAKGMTLVAKTSKTNTDTTDTTDKE